jgi:hydroxymethylbilane synthase
MPQPQAVVRIGTRASVLARRQTEHVRAALARVWPDGHFEVQLISTTGDRVLDTPLPLIGGKGLFTAELEAALRAGTIDLAVHSLKDLPTELPEGLVVGAILPRADPHDVLISRTGRSLEALPEGARLGTSSTRRAAQLLSHRPDLKILDLRGNADTRVRKALDPSGPYDAILVARAALERLDRLDVATQVLSDDLMLPAPGQGAMAVQCRDEQRVLEMVRPLNHVPTEVEVVAERAFLEGLGGGCAVPVAAYARLDEKGLLHLRGRVSSPDGVHRVDVAVGRSVHVSSRPDPTAARRVGLDLAALALQQGAGELLKGRA